MAQSVEHVIGNDEVISSILITSSKKTVAIAAVFLIGLWFKLGFLFVINRYNIPLQILLEPIGIEHPLRHARCAVLHSY